MPKLIEVPGMGVVEFPDGMADDQIAQAIRRNSAPQGPTTADETGALDAFFIGAGRSTKRIGQGMQQLYYGAKSKFDSPDLNSLITGRTSSQRELDRLAADVAEEERLYAPLQQKRPIATGLGSALPALALPAGGATTMAFLGRSALSGAAPGLLSYGSAEDRLTSGAVGAAGGVAGGGVGLAAGRLLKPAGVGSAGVSDGVLAAADRLGVKLSAGQRTQNPAMVNFENYLAKSPGSSGAMQARTVANQQAMNRAAAGAMGQSGDDLSEGVFLAAKNGIGSEFDRLQQVTAPQLGNDFLNALAKIDSSNLARGSFRSKSVDSLVDKGIDLAAQGKLTGTAYKEIRTQLTNESQSAFRGGDATLGQALKTVRAALDDAAKASLTKADQEAWDTARAQWAAYKELTRANVAEGGNVSAARLASGLRRGSDGLRTGQLQGPLSDIARLGEAVKGSANPNSGQLMQQMLYGNPLSGLPMMAGNKAAEMAYMNPVSQYYLSRGLLDIGSGGRVLTGNAGLLSGLGGAQHLQGLLGAQ